MPAPSLVKTIRRLRREELDPAEAEEGWDNVVSSYT
jgi:hypothetical protein